MKKKMALLLTTMAFVIPFGQISTAFAAVATGIIKQDRILVSVPSGEVFKNLGFNVSLNNNIVTIKDSAHTVTLENGKNSFTTDGKTITPDVPQQIINNIFHIPVRAIAESVGAKVSWNAATKTATITYNAKEVNFVWNTPEESTIRGAYKKALANAPAAITGKTTMKKSEYYLYDIDHDGQPELIIKYSGYSDKDELSHIISKVYSFKNGILYDCGTTPESNSNTDVLRGYEYDNCNGFLVPYYNWSFVHYSLKNNKLELVKDKVDFDDHNVGIAMALAEDLGVDVKKLDELFPDLKAIAINDTTAINNIAIKEGTIKNVAITTSVKDLPVNKNTEVKKTSPDNKKTEVTTSVKDLPVDKNAEVKKAPTDNVKIVQKVGPMISSGSGYSVVLKSDGTVWTWGSNGNGNEEYQLNPIQVKGLTGVASVCAGSQHKVALKSDGTVWTWGSNWSGQLGDGTKENHLTPVQVKGLTDMTSVSTRGNHTVALKSDGTVWTWGSNGYGELGDGSTEEYRSIPVQVKGLTGVTSVSAGSNHTIALKSDGTIWAWGDNMDGLLGDGSKENQTTPVQVAKDLTGVTSVSAGSSHAVALKNDGTVWAWGDNGLGQLGDGTTEDRFTPVQVKGLTGVTSVSAGTFHTMALKNDGTIWAWGDNMDGLLGDGTRENRLTPVQVKALSGVKAISTGNSHTIALKNDGTILTWGYNNSGELGYGTTSNKITPIPSLVPNFKLF